MKQLSKQILSFLLSNDVVIWLYLKLRMKRSRIILYHGVSDSADELISSQVIRSEVFEKQMAYLNKYYKNIPLMRVIAGCDALGNGITITFDDGYENVFRTAFPLLHKFGMTASVFVNPKFIDQTEEGNYQPAWWDIFDNLFDVTTAGQFIDVFRKYEICFTSENDLVKLKTDMEETLKDLPATKNDLIAQELQFRFSPQMMGKGFPRLMTWNQLRQLSDKGFEIGVHTMSHLSVASLPEERYRYELIDPKKVIESRLGIKVFSFAFPFGGENHFSIKSLNVLKEAGYLCALTVSAKVADPFCLSRISIHKNDDFRMFKIKVAGIYEDIYLLYRKLKRV